MSLSILTRQLFWGTGSAVTSLTNELVAFSLERLDVAAKGERS